MYKNKRLKIRKEDKLYSIKSTDKETLGKWSMLLTLACVILGLTACETLGPMALRQGRNNYNSAINNTDTQEFLLNVVRLRYNDKPYVLQIATITSRSEREIDITGSYDWGKTERTKGRSSKRWETRHGTRAAAGFGYKEAPNIVYQPLRGDKFVQ